MIIKDIKSGNRKVFREFFEDYYPILCSFALKYLRDKQHSEDVAQDVLLKYWENRQNYASIEEVKAFLYTAVRNQCINILKREQVGERYVSFMLKNEEEGFEEEVLEHEVLLLLQQAIKSLPGQMKRIIEFSLHGKRNAEIAQEMGIAEGTLHKLKKIAYKKLRELMNGRF